MSKLSDGAEMNASRIRINPSVLLDFLKQLNDGIEYSKGGFEKFCRDKIPENAGVRAIMVTEKGDLDLWIESDELPRVARDCMPPIMTTDVRWEACRPQTLHQERVEEFMCKAEQEIPEKPTIPSEEVRRLRAILILEEAFETVKALGFGLYTDYVERNKPIDLDNADVLTLIGSDDPNLQEIADGCADIIVVTTGTLSACGIKDNALQMEVDRSNLAKFGPGGRKREDGKWIKPPDWQPPRIKEILEEQSRDSY